MKHSTQTPTTILSTDELQKINGGAEAPKPGFWNSLSYYSGAVIHGLLVFGSEGGRNAGLTVK